MDSINEEKQYNDNLVTHDSYGIVKIARISSGGDQPFFGSNIQSNQWIEISVNRAAISRSIDRDSVMPINSEQIVNFRLNFKQFAELISSGTGRGVPCTLNTVLGKNIANMPTPKSIKERMSDDFNKRKQEVVADIKEKKAKLSEIVKKGGSLSKKDKEALFSILDRVERFTGSDMEYYQSVVDEKIESSVAQGKTELESYAANIISNIGKSVITDERFSITLNDNKEIKKFLE